MFAKTIFFTIYSLTTNLTFYLLVMFLLITYMFLTAGLRQKIFLFILLNLLSVIWGFLYDLDGLFLILLTTELTLLLIFLITYMQLYQQLTFSHKTTSSYIFTTILICLLSIKLELSGTLTHVNYYQYVDHIVASDFFILYYILFEKLPFISILLILLISLFSFFFILVFFNLKLVKNKQHKTLKLLTFIRKQTLLKQTTFPTKLHTFQN